MGRQRRTKGLCQGRQGVTSSSWEPAEFERRWPVWHALSELYLDTELQPSDYRGIAQRLRRSGYSVPELRQILEDEVGPAFVFNLLEVAGEWAPWTEEEVRRIMIRSSKALPPMRWLKRRMFRRHLEAEWVKLAPLLAE